MNKTLTFLKSLEAKSERERDLTQKLLQDGKMDLMETKRKAIGERGRERENLIHFKA